MNTIVSAGMKLIPVILSFVPPASDPTAAESSVFVTAVIVVL